jgi:hypothetical protein
VAAVIRLNTRWKWAWSAKPTSSATSAMGAPARSRAFAYWMRRLVWYSCGATP